MFAPTCMRIKPIRTPRKEDYVQQNEDRPKKSRRKILARGPGV